MTTVSARNDSSVGGRHRCRTRSARAAGCRRGERGFGLIEVIVSVLLLLVSMVGVTQMQLVASGSNATGRHMTQASQLAQHLAERMQTWPYNDPRLEPGATVTGTAATWTAVQDTTDTMATSMHFGLGDFSDATKKSQRGTDPLLPPAALDAQYRVFWNVTAEDQNSDGIAELKLIQIVVRWRDGYGWHNVNFVQSRFNLDALRPT